MKTTNSALKENILAIVIAFVLAVSIAFVISRISFLKADIMGADTNQEQNLVDVDFVVSKSEKEFKVISNKKIEGVQSIIFDLVYDPNKVKITDDNIAVDDYSFSQIDTGHIEIVVNNVGRVEKGQEVLILNNVDGRYINLGSIQILFTDGKLETTFQIKTK